MVCLEEENNVTLSFKLSFSAADKHTHKINMIYMRFVIEERFSEHKIESNVKKANFDCEFFYAKSIEICAKKYISYSKYHHSRSPADDAKKTVCLLHLHYSFRTC